MHRLILLLVLLTPTLTFAQGAGTLAGRVIDDTGEALPGANVLIEGTTLGAAADIDGNYRIIGVPVGTYTVTASFTGFASDTRYNVDVSSGYTRTVDFMMEPGLESDGEEVIIVMCCRCGVNNDPFAPRVLSGEMILRLPTGR